jgi:hypothetical protein
VRELKREEIEQLVGLMRGMMKEELQPVVKRLNSLEQGFGRLEQRQEQLEQGFGRLEQRQKDGLTEMRSHFKRVEDKLDTHEFVADK